MESQETSFLDQPIRVALRGAGGLLGHRLLRTILGKCGPEMEVTSVILGTDEESFRRLQSACRALPFTPDINVYVDERRRKLGDLMLKWGSPWELKPLDQHWGDLKKTDAIVDASILRGNDAMRDFLSRYSRTRPVIHQSGVYPAHQLIAGPFDPERPRENFNYRQGDCLLSGMAPLLFPFAERIAHVNIHVVVQRQTRLNDYTLRRQPRVFMAPPEIPVSTGQVRQRLREPYLENGIPLQPIICFECDGGIEVSGRQLLIQAVFHSKAITMLPNIDAIRGLVRGMAMRKAMEETDRQMGFWGGYADTIKGASLQRIR